jgi:hypothetical protein
VGTVAAAEAAADTSIVVAAAAASVGSGSATASLSEEDSSLHWHAHVMRFINPLARETAQLYVFTLHFAYAYLVHFSHYV